MLSLVVTLWAVSLVVLATVLGAVITVQTAVGWARRLRSAWSFRAVRHAQPSTVRG